MGATTTVHNWTYVLTMMQKTATKGIGGRRKRHTPRSQDAEDTFSIRLLDPTRDSVSDDIPSTHDPQHSTTPQSTRPRTNTRTRTAKTFACCCVRRQRPDSTQTPSACCLCGADPSFFEFTTTTTPATTTTTAPPKPCCQTMRFQPPPHLNLTNAGIALGLLFIYSTEKVLMKALSTSASSFRFVCLELVLFCHAVVWACTALTAMGKNHRLRVAIES